MVAGDVDGLPIAPSRSKILRRVGVDAGRGLRLATRGDSSGTACQMSRLDADTAAGEAVAVLVSGGADSAILCVDLAARGRRVQPIYVRFGLRWEAVELDHLSRFLAAVARPQIQPLLVFEEPVREVYGSHWSTGREADAVPDAETPDEAVYLPGRNLLLTLKAAIWCRQNGVERIALGSLGSNPFADSSPSFFESWAGVVNLGLGGRMRFVRPYGDLHKAEVLRIGAEWPLELTFSCLNPVDGKHCGVCNKCAERRRGFAEAGLTDRTSYACAGSTSAA